MKILAMQFRYLGDAVLVTPALRAVKQHFRDSSLHMLVPEEVVPVLQHIPWLERVWSFPRKRGRANFTKSWPVIRALRKEHFDCSIDFSGNDRSAIISLLCGARKRVAPRTAGGFLGRRFCYTQTVSRLKAQHQGQRNFDVLSVWGISTPACPVCEIYADPSLSGVAEQILPGSPIICHLATSQLKKEWPIENWLEFHRLAKSAGHEVVFCAGPTVREQALLSEFKSRSAEATVLPSLSRLAEFIAVLKRGRLFISGDTGPLHLAAGLGIPTLSLFGPSSPAQWAPCGLAHCALRAPDCSCGGDTAICLSPKPCMSNISPQQVMNALEEMLISAKLLN